MEDKIASNGMPILEIDHDAKATVPLVHRSAISRQELIGILTMDGTIDEITQAIEGKELTDAEFIRICDWLRCEDPNRAEVLFAEILKDVEAAPEYESGKEEKKAWKDMRVELAHEIKDLHDQRYALMDEIDRFNEAAAGLEHSCGSKYAEDFRRQATEHILEAQEKLDIKTKQHGALALMHAEAKSMTAQANARIFAEETKPLRDTLKNGWQSLTEQARASHVHAVNLRRALNQTNDLDFHPIGDTLNKIRVAHAKSQMKHLNRVQEKLDKAEQKMIARANKISKKEFRRSTFLNNLEGWSKGVQVPKQELEVITDVKRAQEVLGESKYFADRRLAAMQKNLDGLHERRDNAEAAVLKTMEHIATDMRQRRDGVQRAAQTIAEQARNGELGKVSARKMGRIERNLQKGMDASFIATSGKGGLTEDLVKFAQEHGLSDIIEGYEPEEINPAQEDVEIGESPEIVDIEQAEQDMPELNPEEGEIDLEDPMIDNHER